MINNKDDVNNNKIPIYSEMQKTKIIVCKGNLILSKKMRDFGKDPIKQLLICLAVPAIVAQLVNMLYNIVDRIYIGHIQNVGTDALTGVGVTMPIIILISAFSALIGMGGASQSAIKMGQKNHEGAEKILGNCLSALLCISVALTAIFLLFGEQLLLLFGASENTIVYASQYMTIYVCGTVFVQLTLGLNPFITTQGFAKISMLTVVIGAVINIILDPILIFGLNMGVMGAALATVISQAVSATWVVLFLESKNSLLRIKKKNLKIESNVILPVMILGVSPFIMQSTESVLNIAFNTSLLKYGGDIAVGAMTIMASISQLILMPIAGMAQGAQPIIGYNFGSKQTDRVKQTFKLLITYVMIFVVIFWLLIMIAPQIFVSIFTKDPMMIEYATWSSRIYLFGLIIFGAQITCQQTLVALGQAKLSTFLALLRKVVLLIPLIYIVPLFLSQENKVLGVLIAAPIADIIASTIAFILFKKHLENILE